MVVGVFRDHEEDETEQDIDRERYAIALEGAEIDFGIRVAVRALLERIAHGPVLIGGHLFAIFLGIGDGAARVALVNERTVTADRDPHVERTDIARLDGQGRTVRQRRFQMVIALRSGADGGRPVFSTLRPSISSSLNNPPVRDHRVTRPATPST